MSEHNLSMEKRKRRKRKEKRKSIVSKGNAAAMPTAQLTEEDHNRGKIDILYHACEERTFTSKSEASPRGTAGRRCRKKP